MSSNTNRTPSQSGQKRGFGSGHEHGHGGPAGALGRPVEKAKNFRGTLNRLLGYLKPQTFKLILVAVFAIIGTVFTVIAPRITGNAMNSLTDGFIAKQIVDNIGKAQDKAVPEIKKQLDNMDSAKAAALSKTQSAVASQFNKAVDSQKQQAASMAVGKVDSAVENAVSSKIAAQKQQVTAAAIAKADSAVESAVSSKIAVQKQQATAAAIAKADSAVKTQVEAMASSQAAAAAKAEVDQKFAAVPGGAEGNASAYNAALAQAQSQAAQAAITQADAQLSARTGEAGSALATAEAKASAAVDSGFAAQQGQMASQIASAKVQAEAKAKQAVDSGFAAQQGQMASQIASAKTQAEAKAKQAVDSGFAAKQADINTKLSSAQKEAASKVNEEFNKQMAKKVSASQLQAMKDMIALPEISKITDANQKADAIQKFISLSKKFPASASMKSGSKNISSFKQSDIDKYIKDVRETNGVIPYGIIATTLLTLLGIYLLSAFFTFLMQFLMSSVAQRTVYSLRKELNDKLSRLPLKYFDSHTNGEVLSRMTNDIDTISSTLQQSLTQLIQSIFQIIGYVVLMLTYSVVLTIIVLCTLPLYVTVTMVIAKRSQKYFAAQQQHLGELSGHTEEMFTGHIIVKAFGHEKDSVNAFENMNDELYDAGWKAQFMSGVMFPLMNFVSNIGYVLIAVVGGIFVTRNLLNIGDITAFIQYSRSFSMPIVQTANIANIIQSTIACAERVFEVLDEKEEIPDTADSLEIRDPKGNITFDHVNFHYKENEPLIEDLNLNFKQGETVAIVGPTGAGKTTLVNLLMRFYEINAGTITFDGVDTRKIKRGSLRTLFGMVLQDTWLFNGTIEDNIAYGRENATQEQILKAAKAAHADHFIRSLPDGYKTVLDEEASNISQGQKQLLTIARAILADPTVLILDEATSNVDTRTEVLIQKAMEVLMKGRTNFVIAHRLSTIRDAHLILVMNHGTIIEHGNHAELMAKNGFYADLYNSQFTGANLADNAG